MTVVPIASTDRHSSRERRQHPRIPAPHISASPFHGDLDIVNLSRRGMLVLSHNPLSIGGTYLFELWQEGNSLVIEGAVRWSRPQGVANEEEAPKESRYRAGVAFERVRSRERRDPWPTEVVQSPTRGRPVDRLAVARKTLAEADSIHVAAEGLLDVLEPMFERLVLFRCHANALRAWMGRGRTLRPLRLQSLEISLDQPSMFLHLREGGSFFRGRLPAMPVHQDLVETWNGDLEKESVLVPIRIGHRMVTVLYADTGDEAPSSEDLDLLRRAGRLLEESITRLILRQKAESRDLGDSPVRT
ncbi:MAG: PilZ domain-containing protein [Thermoanaerobaculia bacterium]